MISNELMSLKPSDVRLAIFAPFGDWAVHEQVNAVVGASMLARGATVRVIGCDGVFFKNCYILMHQQDKESSCARCQATSHRLFSQFGLTIDQIRNYIKDNDFQEAKNWANNLNPSIYPKAEYQGLKIGEWITPLVCSYFKRGLATLHYPKAQSLHKYYLLYALLTYKALSYFIEKFNPTHILTYAGAGMLHSAVLEIGLEKKIPTICHTLGRAEGSYLFTSNEIVSAFKSRFEVANNWKDVPLDSNSFMRISDYFAERRTGVNHNFLTYYHQATDEVSLKQRLNIPLESDIVSFFSSSEYEKIYYKEYEGLPSQLDIISELINIFRNRDEYLVIRHHPQIAGWDNIGPDTEFLTRSYQMLKNLPDNVRVIMPEETITSYSLVRNSVACFAPFSTIGLEALAMGIPTAICSTSIYSPGSNIKFDDYSYNGIEQTLLTLLKYKYEIKDLKKLYRYMDAFIYKHSVTFNTVQSGAKGGVKVSKIEDLLEGGDPGLDRICNHILKNSSLYQVPTETDLNNSELIESECLEKEFEIIQKAKNDFNTALKQYKSTSMPKFQALILQRPSYAWNNDNIINSIKRQRLAITNYNFLELGDLNTHESLSLIKLNIESLDSSYIWISTPAFLYNESFLMEAYNALSANPNKSGSVWGGWNKDPEFGIEYSILSKINPENSYEEAKNRIAILENPEHLLGFCLFKKDALIKLIDNLLLLSNKNEISLSLYSTLRSEEYHYSNLPVAMIYSATKPEIDKEVNNFELLRERLKFEETHDTLILTNNQILNNPETIENILQTAVDCINQKKFGRSIKLLKLFDKLSTPIPTSYFLLAIAQANSNQIFHAKDSIDKYLQLVPDHQDGLHVRNQIYGLIEKIS
jgi:hypothetical protein